MSVVSHVLNVRFPVKVAMSKCENGDDCDPRDAIYVGLNWSGAGLLPAPNAFTFCFGPEASAGRLRRRRFEFARDYGKT